MTVSAAGLPGRYAAALFDLARQEKAIDPIAEALTRTADAIAASPALAALITAPQVRREQAGRAIAAVADELKLPPLAANFLGVLAANGRLAQLPAIITSFQSMLASHKGLTTARVTSAQPLTAAQKKTLLAKLKARTGRDMALDTHVDPSLLGGLVVRIGSEQIDSSIKTRLERLGQQMKGLS